MVDCHKADLPTDPEVCQSKMSDKERFDKENQGAMQNRDYREISGYWDEHECPVIKARLTAEQGAQVQKAIDAALESVKAAEPSPESLSHALEAETPVLNTTRLDNQQHPRRRADVQMRSCSWPKPCCAIAKFIAMPTTAIKLLCRWIVMCSRSKCLRNTMVRQTVLSIIRSACR